MGKNIFNVRKKGKVYYWWTSGILQCSVVFFFFFSCGDSPTESEEEEPIVLSLLSVTLDAGSTATLEGVIDEEQKTVTVTTEEVFGMPAATSAQVTALEVTANVQASIAVGDSLTLTKGRSSFTVGEESYTFVVRTAAPTILSTYIWPEADIKDAGENKNVLGQAVKEDRDGIKDFTLFKIGNLKAGKDFTVKMKTDGVEKVSPPLTTTAEGTFDVNRNNVYQDVFTASASDATNAKNTIVLSFSPKEDEERIEEITFLYKPTEIWSWRDLQAIEKNLEGDYVQKQNIVFEDGDGNGKGDYNFKPIGSKKPFMGNYYGSGHAIENLYIDRDTTNNVGLFSVVGKKSGINSEKKINVFLKNAHISGKAVVGGIAGTSHWIIIGALKGGSVKGAVPYSTSQQQNFGTRIGGIVGEAHNAVYGYNTASVEGVFVIGGIVGFLEWKNDHSGFGKARLHGFNLGNVKAIHLSIGRLVEAQMGGLVGVASNAEIVGYNKGIIEGAKRGGKYTRSVGELVGSIYGKVLLQGYGRGRLKLDNAENPRTLECTFGKVVGGVGSLQLINDLHAYRQKENGISTSDVRECLSSTWSSVTVIEGEEIDTVAVRDKTKADIQGMFTGLSTNRWSFFDNKWPAVKIPFALGDLASLEDQPIEP